MWSSRSLTSSAFALLLVVSSAQPEPARAYQDTLDPQFLISGATMSERECATITESVWVMVSDRGDCIRFFSSGLRTKNEKAIVYFHGDCVSRTHAPGDFFDTVRYNVVCNESNTPDSFKLLMQRLSAQSALPAMFVARPGVFGSSGDHKNKRQPREVELMNAALDKIKEKHNIKRFIAAGQSGGGHIVGAMLARRSDIECAVLASAAVAVAARIKTKQWPADATGYKTFYDPIDHVKEIPNNTHTRIFVIGDPRDAAVPFATQSLYYEALKEHGLDAHLLKATGLGNEHHGLQPWAFRVAAWCAQNVPTAKIVEGVKLD
jgi:predicted esterase